MPPTDSKVSIAYQDTTIARGNLKKMLPDLSDVCYQKLSVGRAFLIVKLPALFYRPSKPGLGQLTVAPTCVGTFKVLSWK